VKSEIINKPILILVGPTAIGKTVLSMRIAERNNCEIVSVDSMQVYRHMDIGTAKVTEEEQRRITHHLIDIVDPNENYDAARYTVDALKSIRDIHGRGKIPLLTGGTGLYLRALLHGIFPGVPANEEIRTELKQRLAMYGCSKLHRELYLIDRISADKINENDSQRVLRALEVFMTSGIPWSKHLEEQRQQKPEKIFNNLLQIGLTCNRTKLYDRINERCQIMLEAGLEQEVQNLLDLGYSRSLKSLGAIGYRHMISYLDGEWSWEEMAFLLARDTRRYAKRQFTWFSKMVELQWFEVNEPTKIIEFVDSWLAKKIVRN
jgi:tRNA dimethylallyltransferase